MKFLNFIFFILIISYVFSIKIKSRKTKYNGNPNYENENQFLNTYQLNFPNNYQQQKYQ